MEIKQQLLNKINEAANSLVHSSEGLKDMSYGILLGLCEAAKIVGATEEEIKQAKKI